MHRRHHTQFQPLSAAFCLLLGGATAAMAQSPAPANPPAPDEVAVFLDEPIQKDFLGVNGVYHGFAFMPEQVQRGMDDADRAREFGRVAAMKLNIARTWYRPDWACGTNITDACDWETPKMKAFYAWLAAMKERGVDVALQTGWWFPGDTYYGLPGPKAADDPPRYAKWVSESVNQLVKVRGFANIKYLILFTEPTTTSTGNLPPNEEIWGYYAKVVKAIHGQLVADGRRSLVKLVGPNNTAVGRHLAEAVRDLKAELDILSGHDYNLSGYSGWLAMCDKMQTIAASADKPLWLDEYGKQDEPYRRTADYGNYVAQVVAASINAGVQTSTIWLLFDQQYVSCDGKNNINEWNGSDSFYKGVHRWGTCKWPGDSIEKPTLPYFHWYTFSLLSRYMGGRNGTQSLRTRCADDLWIAATRQRSGESSFLVINGREGASRAVSVRFNRPLGRTLYRYLYDPTAIVPTEAATLIGYSKTLPDVGASFTDELPARAVAVYSTLKDEPAAVPASPTGLVAVLEGERSVRLS